MPAVLETAGLLERFYTDLCADVGWGRWLGWAKIIPRLGAKVLRLSRRRLPANIRRKTRTFDALVLRATFQQWKNRRDPEGRVRESLRFNRAFGNAVVRDGFGGATHLFSMLGEGGTALPAARARGLKIVVEVYILLSSQYIMEEECRRFPDWEVAPPDYSTIWKDFVDINALPHIDLAICPSEAVREDLALNFGVPLEKSILLPYGLDPELLDIVPQPRPGRILFAGTAGLRKGIHYLAQAAEQLAGRGRSYQFIVAGNVSPQIAQRPDCRFLTFLGRVPRQEMVDQFRQADVFVLPTLAEGSAEVINEALGVGLPVITTRAAGSVVRDGIEGRIVPERDPTALAATIDELLSDRPQRDRMAAAARERARDYTWDRYGERLLQALRQA